MQQFNPAPNDVIADQNQINHVSSTVDETITIKPYQKFTRLTLAASVDLTINLPSPMECIGQILTIFVLSAAGSNTVILSGNRIKPTQPNLTATDDMVVLISNGYEWLTLVDIST